MSARKLNIALLCNNKMALPAMQYMAEEGVLCAIATADNNDEVITLIRGKAAEYELPYKKITRKNYREQLVNWLEEVTPDVVFVMTFPWRIPAAVFTMPEFGFLNFHYGLLPEMRGADPIFESIRQRRQVAGITVHIIDEGLDTGPIVMREEMMLAPEITYGMLCSQMAFAGRNICGTLISNLQKEGRVTAIPQDERKAAYWPRIGAEEVAIKWSEMDTATIRAIVRACNPIAKGAPVIINGWKIGVCEVADVNLQGDASAIKPGTIVALDMQNGLVVCCKDGKALRLEVIYTEEGFFPGYKLAFFGITAGMVFDNISVSSVFLEKV
jgi:methionyl-tRNA formyltransferase